MARQRKQKVQKRATWSAGRECWKYRRTYIIVCALSVLLSLLVSISSQKKYSAQVTLVNETASEDILLGLDNFTAFIKQQQRAFGKPEGLKNPEIYATIIESDSFLNDLSQVYIPAIHKTYNEYLNHNGNSDSHELLERIKDNVKYQVSSKYGKIVLEVTDKDPVIAAILVDSATKILQRKITRAQNANMSSTTLNEKKKFELAKNNYETSQKRYAAYCDKNQDLILSGNKSQAESLRKDRDDFFTLYQKAAIQYERSLALSQKEIPSFVVVRNATVPREPSEPQSIAIFLSFITMGLIFTTWGILIHHHIRTS